MLDRILPLFFSQKSVLAAFSGPNEGSYGARAQFGWLFESWLFEWLRLHSLLWKHSALHEDDVLLVGA